MPAGNRIIAECDAQTILGQLRPHDLRRLVAVSTVHACDRTAFPPVAGEGSRSVLLVTEGLLGLHHTLWDGRQCLSELLRPGYILDLRRDQRRFQGDLVALCESRIWLLDTQVLDDICRSDQSVGASLVLQQREQMHALRDHCVDIGKKTPNERIASFLLEVLCSSDVQRGEVVTIPISRTAISEYVALRAETVSRSFAALQSMELVACIGSGAVRVRDAAGLRQLANGAMPRGSNGPARAGRAANEAGNARRYTGTG